MKRFKKMPSPALIVAMVALVAAMGGSAYAGIKIGTKQLKSNAVTAPKIKNGAVTTPKIKDGAVTTGKLNGQVPAVAWAEIDGTSEAIDGEGGVGIESVAQGSVSGTYCIQANFQPKVVVAQPSALVGGKWSSTYPGSVFLVCPSGTEATVIIWTQDQASPGTSPEISPSDFYAVLY